MNNLIALGIKLSGLGILWTKIDGYKTKIAAGGLLLSGGGMVLIGSAGIIAELVACADISCAIGLGRGIQRDINWPNIVNGSQTFLTGLGMLGLKHAVSKSSAAPAQAQP